MQVTVRGASGGDAAALAGLRLRALTESGGSGEPDSAAFIDAFTGWLADHLTTHLAFLAEVGTDVAGMAWLMVAERVPSPERPRRRCGDVQAVYVLPELRGRGVGAALLGAVLAEARRLDLEHVTVHSTDRAVPLYRRAGFGPDPRWLRWEP